MSRKIPGNRFFHFFFITFVLFFHLKSSESSKLSLFVPEKRRIEEEEDVAWDKYVESQTDEWNLENVIPGELSLEVEQEFKHSNRNWTVVEKKGCDEQGFQYLLVLVSFGAKNRILERFFR